MDILEKALRKTCEELTREELISLVCQLIGEGLHSAGRKKKENVMLNKAHWVVWPGWEGNHDRRIEGVKCSKCYYEHPTVYDSLDNLSKQCGGCGRKMSNKGEVNNE